MEKVSPLSSDAPLGVATSSPEWTSAKASFTLGVVALAIKRLRADTLAAEDADTVEGLLSLVRSWLAGQP